MDKRFLIIEVDRRHLPYMDRIEGDSLRHDTLMDTVALFATRADAEIKAGELSVLHARSFAVCQAISIVRPPKAIVEVLT